MASEGYHEPYEALPEDARDLHRAITSLIEELEAVDWYHQRAAVTPDADLKAILEHNRDEEIEHAMMTLEWIRRRSPKFAAHMRTYLFTEGPITEIEEAADRGANETTAAKATHDGSLGIGTLNRPQEGA